MVASNLDWINYLSSFDVIVTNIFDSKNIDQLISRVDKKLNEMDIHWTYI